MGCRHAIQACSCLIIDWGNWTDYPNMLCTTKLSQHAVSQSEAREVRHMIPACSNLESYPSMQLANERPGKLDMLSQHA